MRFAWLVVVALAASGGTPSAGNADPTDCSKWALDGYRVGMRGDELLAVRSVTLHVERQAQAIEPGKLYGVLVLDASNRLEKWDVLYDPTHGDALRAEMKSSFGEPISDVSGDLWNDGSSTARQRRSIWRSTTCDAAIILYDDTFLHGSASRSVHATLIRASSLPPGLVEMKTLFH